MMRLPACDRAVVDIEKLVDYCLNPVHPRGRHKARVFVSALGITADKAEELRAAIMAAILENDAAPTDSDDFGRRYVLDFMMTTEIGSASIRTRWIVRNDEDFPRLTTCYVI